MAIYHFFYNVRLLKRIFTDNFLSCKFQCAFIKRKSQTGISSIIQGIIFASIIKTSKLNCVIQWIVQDMLYQLDAIFIVIPLSKKCIGGVMGGVLFSSVVDHGFEP